VSLPELARIRAILGQDRLFLVVQDIFLTETAALADVVLPAATWGEKTGTFTNVDRTVHLSENAVGPPGDARPDLDIFLDYARRLDLKDKDGGPLVHWTDAESAFEAWKACSAGRPCDYTGLTYAMLRGPSGIQWPVNAANPRGTERLYADSFPWAAPDMCESYGKDTVTGAPSEPADYKAVNPDGKALLKGAPFVPPHEVPSEEFPYVLTTGRTLFQFHTRTKTGRAPQLDRAAPQVWVEMSPADAEREGLREGDLLQVSSPRASVRARLRVSGIRDGVVFLPFHYGYWDGPDTGPRAANELTITDWDPLSKQPIFKTAAAAVLLLDRDGQPSPAPTNTASAPAGSGGTGDRRRSGRPRRGGARVSTTARPGIALFLREVHAGETDLERELRAAGERHRTDHEVRHVTVDLARWSLDNRQALADRYGADLSGDQDSQSPARPMARLRERTAELLGRRPEPGLLLLHDLRHLYLLASGNSVHWTALAQAAQAVRDSELLAVVTACHSRTMRQAVWCNATIKTVSAQVPTSL